MPVGNRLQTYDNYLNSGVEAKDALDVLGVTKLCCRRMLYTAPIEPLLRRPLPHKMSFVKIHEISKLASKPYTLSTSGSTEPI